MQTLDFNTKLIDGYMELLRNLSSDNKLDLITKLSESLKSTSHEDEPSLKNLFGAYQSDQSAEELIAEIRQSRLFNRNIENL
ncbi:hypothetical protein [Mucilaginibacter paludis]|uniref:Uncharacterized protein n=1 Tax=Mucilaginibacter paludis DSM 18603 TaxID=714943 RepID=H1Y7G1_9SPHI|nr:hypothetical protein [Mucilaginibacter paludis]EHQ29382.1 hypothetical protein Mucpa_5307 [Mucilaginibacter paludis DSM 18603]